MTTSELIALFAAFAVAVGAVSTLVIQTARLVTIAEQYMVELRSSNRNVAASAGVIADVVAAAAETQRAAPSMTERPRYLRPPAPGAG